jgi:hypothetical protein
MLDRDCIVHGHFLGVVVVVVVVVKTGGSSV